MSFQQKQQEAELLKLRDEIDAIDKQIHLLINQRANCAQRVAQVKEKFQGVEDAVFYRPEREAQVLRKVMERNEGPLDDKAIARLFREVMSVCLAHEKPLNIAYLGPAGAFSQLAANKHFGNSAITIAANSLTQVFNDVDAGFVNYGVVPIENSTQGIATQTLDLFKKYPLNICGEVELDVQLNLYGLSSIALADIVNVYALNETLIQCGYWLDQHCPNAKRVVTNSLQEAEKLSQVDDQSGVVAADGALASQWRVVAQNISSNNEHKARFLIVGNQKVLASGLDKTSLLVAAKDQPGALYDLLTPFRESDISLLKIETYTGESPLGLECSVFYIDFEGHQNDTIIKSVLAQVKDKSVEMKVLGSYPRAVI